MGEVEVIGQAQVDAWAARVLPPVEELPGGIWSVPVPIPDNPLRYTSSYVLPGSDGLLVVDPGWATDEGWAALTAGLAAAGAAPSDVVGIVATHVHEDHHGLSGRLAGESGAWIAMHRAEADSMPHRSGVTTHTARRTAVTAWLHRCGASDEEIAELTGPGGTAPANAMMAEPDVLLEDGDPLPLAGREVRTVWTPGHTPGHICLHDIGAGVFLTGDHVLPRITPNIGLSYGGEAPALAYFLDSLEAVARIDEEHGGLTALPAHEYRFAGLAGRARALQAHHAARCRELLDVVAESDEPTLWELTRRLTWSRPWPRIGRMRIGALAETIAHVRYLVDREELECLGDLPTFASPAPAATVRVRLPLRVA